MRDVQHYTMDLLKDYDTSDLRYLYNKLTWELKSLRRQSKTSRWNQEMEFYKMRHLELAREQLGQFIVDLAQHTLAVSQKKLNLDMDTPAKVFAKYDVKVTLIPKD